MDRVPNLQVRPATVSGQASYSSHPSLLVQPGGDGESAPGATPPPLARTHSPIHGSAPQSGVETVGGVG